MSLPLLSRLTFRAAGLAAALAASLLPLGAAEQKAATNGNGWNLSQFVDELPEMLADRLPNFAPSGAVRLYVRPHFGDFLHRDYVRVPIGARGKVSDTIECSAELQSYFTHGLRDAAGYGLSGLQLGAKREHVLPFLGHGGISIGANFQTPLSRPPQDLTDGHRHFMPYLAASRPLVPAWRLLGYAGVNGDFLNHTAMPAHFGQNQLHANSITFGAGVAREWKRVRTSLTATVATSALTSDEGKQVYSLRPEIVMPWRLRPDARSEILLTLGGRAIHGPDGNELGVSGSVRVEFSLGRRAAAKK